MSVTHETLLRHLDACNAVYLPAPDGAPAVSMTVRTRVGFYHMRMIADDQVFQCIGWVPISAPPGCMGDVADALHMANYGMKLGRFEIDFEDGEVRFHAASLLIDGILPVEIIDRLQQVTLLMLDMYAPAILSVIYANELPEDAVDRVEAGERPESAAEDEDCEGTEA